MAFLESGDLGASLSLNFLIYKMEIEIPFSGFNEI